MLDKVLEAAIEKWIKESEKVVPWNENAKLHLFAEAKNIIPALMLKIKNLEGRK